MRGISMSTRSTLGSASAICSMASTPSFAVITPVALALEQAAGDLADGQRVDHHDERRRRGLYRGGMHDARRRERRDLGALRAAG